MKIGVGLEEAESIQRERFNKMDYWKRYSEEMLKVKHMRMIKK